MTLRMFELEMAIKLLALMGMLALVILAVYAWTQRRVIFRFWCEARKRFVLVRFISSPFCKKYIDVEFCSAFRKGEPIDCGKRCLDYTEPTIEHSSAR